ncbi:MAG: hypothetical protein L6R00_17630 [Phycisphaerae bacterium]|nr:hypothetical protein [Phycisphaerae bacterium]
MADVFLIHWNKSEANERAARIRAMGHTVRVECADGARAGREILARPPHAVVIDLSRLPSHGRATAGGIRGYKAGRDIPLILLPGAPEKMEKVRREIPDAVWSTWDGLSLTLASLPVRSPAASAAEKRASDGVGQRRGGVRLAKGRPVRAAPTTPREPAAESRSTRTRPAPTRRNRRS